MALHTTRETELFAILVELLGERKLERNALRVLAGARGHELGRPYLTLCQQGLIEESRVRPGFLARLFGARETLWVRVTDHGQQVAARAKTVALPVEAPPLAPPEPPPVEAPAPKVETARPPAPPRPARRYTPADFTEDLGGAPVEAGVQALSSDRLDGLAESLGLLGFELTDAGRYLAVARWAEGLADAQVALEIVTAALAHAVRLDAMGTARLDPEAASGLVGRLDDTFRAYVAEGLLEAESVAAATLQMTAFLDPATAGVGVEGYLADPLRGMAPTAVCPEDIYQRSEVEED